MAGMSVPGSGDNYSKPVAGEETAAAAATGRGGAYARLFGMRHPGTHRRVGVDPLDGFKKDHYRGGSTTPTNTSSAFVGDGGVVIDAKDGRTGQGAGARGGDMPQPKKASGEVSSEKHEADFRRGIGPVGVEETA